MILNWNKPISRPKNVTQIFVGSCFSERNRFFFHKAERKKKATTVWFIQKI